MGVFDKINSQLFGDKPQKLEQVSDQTQDEQKLVSFVKEKVDEGRLNGSRVAHEGIWMTNIAYLLGFDNVYYDTTTRQYRNLGQTNRFLRRSRMHVNKILPTVQNRLARLCKNPPKYDVRPNSNSPEDKDAARLGLEVINNIWDKQKINQKRHQLLMWVQQCGHAYMKLCFDDSLGEPMVNPEKPEEFLYTGDVRCDVVSPFEVFSDPLAKTMDECTWVVQAKVRKLDYFRQHYPDRGHLVKEESAWLLSAQYELRINSLNKQGVDSASTKNQMKNAAIELAYYEKRSRKHPNGRLVVTAGGVLLEDKELPVGEIPFVKFDDVIVAGKFCSESIITHLRPIQDQYNKLITKRAEWTNRLLAGKYMAARGHGMIAEAMNDQSGELLEYNQVPGAPPPSPMPIPNIPQYAYAEEDKLNQMFDQISGINDISHGTLPSASIPALGMQILQEQDETRLGVVTESNEYAYAHFASLILKYVGKYYEMPQLLKIAGNSLEYTVKEFMGKDLRDNYDVICIRGSTIPNSKALKRQEILNAMSQGLLGNPQDEKVRSNVLKMLEYGDIAEVWEDLALDDAQIKEQLDMVKNGQIPPRNEFDNHPVHLTEKNRFRKTDKFKQLDPMSQQILMDDLEWHIQAMVNLTQPQIQQQQDQAKALMQESQDPNLGVNALSPEAQQMVTQDAAQHVQGNQQAS